MAGEPSLHVERRGSGPPLLLVHGIGHRWQAWEPVMDLLAAHHDVIAVDLPGFGRSPLPAGGRLDVAALVAAVRGLADELGLVRPHVAGNSLGGAIALELAMSGAVASATALSPAGFYTAQEARRAGLILGWLRAQSFLPVPVLRAALAVPAVRRSAFGTLVVHPDRLDRERMLGDTLALRRGKGFSPVARSLRDYRFQAGGLAVPPAGAAVAGVAATAGDGDGGAVVSDRDGGVAGDGGAAAGAGDGGAAAGGGDGGAAVGDGGTAGGPVPVTVAWGERDRILPPREAARAREALPWARHVTLPGCGHVPMSDDPELVALTILRTTGAAPAADPTAGAADR
ncbi:MAG TPA: alpha/beta fold hydrolase [Natronosporangium sp.]